MLHALWIIFKFLALLIIAGIVGYALLLLSIYAFILILVLI